MTLPHWITTRAGKLVPFDADEPARDIFAAMESLGEPNALLARELAEGALHFLLQDENPAWLTTTLVAGTTETVLREFGHPKLALAFAAMKAGERSAAPAVDRSVDPFPSDLLAAERDGLLVLYDKAHPHLLAGGILDWHERWMPSAFGGFVALEVPPGEQLHDLPKGPFTFLNFNTNPADADGLFRTPFTATLFDDDAPDVRLKEFYALPDGIRSRCLPIWHRERRGEPAKDWPMEIIDEPDRPIRLGGGLTRGGPAILGTIGMYPLKLLEQMGGGPCDPHAFLKKLLSLTCFARSAGPARQDYLRRFGPAEARGGFLLERAELVVVPVKLEEALRGVLGCGPGPSGVLNDWIKRTVKAMHDALTEPARPPSARLEMTTSFLV